MNVSSPNVRVNRMAVTTQTISSSNPEQQYCARRVTIATPSQYLVKKGEKSADIDHTRVILAGRGHVPVTSALLYCLILLTVYLRAQIHWTAQARTDALHRFLISNFRRVLNVNHDLWDGTECSETSEDKIQTSGNHSKVHNLSELI